MSEIRISQRTFDVASDCLIDPQGELQLQGIPLDQLEQVLDSGFEHPVEFPPIDQAVLTEDTIALAVAHATPQTMQVAELVARRFLRHGNVADNLTIVVANQGSAASPEDAWPVGSDVRVIQHDPTDSNQMSYMMADRAGQPVYVNRILFDADVVVPVGLSDGIADMDSVIPAFCDQETRKYFDRLGPDEYRALVRAANDQLGVFWQIRLVCGPGDQLVDVLVGLSQSVIDQSCRRGSEIWQVPSDNPVDLVLASLESSVAQNWQNARRAILNADHAARQDAAIVLCTHLRERPPADWPLRRDEALIDDDEVTEVFRRRHVYLASELAQDDAEQFGFGHISESAQIQKLIDEHQSCLVLRDAHRVAFTDSPATAVLDGDYS